MYKKNRLKTTVRICTQHTYTMGTYDLQLAHVVEVGEDGEAVLFERGDPASDRLQTVVDAIRSRRALRQVPLQSELVAVDADCQLDAAHLRPHNHVNILLNATVVHAYMP